MAAMSTTLTEFDSRNGSQVSTLSGHSVQQPQLVVETRRVAEGNRVVAEYNFKVVYATQDADGNVLREKVSFEASVRNPIHGESADVAAALVVFRDIVMGDEFEASVSSQNWLPST